MKQTTTNNISTALPLCSLLFSYLIILKGKIIGTTFASKKEIDIKEFIDINQTVEFGICK